VFLLNANVWENVLFVMEEQVPPSSAPQISTPLPGQITPEMIEAFKAQARQKAIQQVLEERSAQYQAQPRPQVVYVRRNLTVAELGLILLIACGIVTGVQAAWNFGSNLLPRIEIKVK
jgi:hypothetical protein